MQGFLNQITDQYSSPHNTTTFTPKLEHDTFIWRRFSEENEKGRLYDY